MVRIFTTLFFLLFLVTISFSQSKVDSIDYYSEKKELIKAINYAKKKSDDFLAQKKYFDFCRISVRKSKLFGTLNDHEKALVTLYKALSISEKNKLKGNAEIIEQIATRYSIIGDSSKAFKNYGQKDEENQVDYKGFWRKWCRPTFGFTPNNLTVENEKTTNTKTDKLVRG